MGSLLAMGTAVLAQEQVQTGSLTTPAPAKVKPAKKAAVDSLATQTEIVAGQNQQPMLTTNSAFAMQGAINMYEEIVAGGGWEDLPERPLKKGAKGEAVIALRQRLVRENYLSFDSLSGDNASLFDQEMVDAVKAFQLNHGILPSGAVAAKTLVELNVPAETRLGMLRENQTRIDE